MASNRPVLLFVIAFFVLVGGALAFLILRDIPAPRQQVEKPLNAPLTR